MHEGIRRFYEGNGTIGKYIAYVSASLLISTVVYTISRIILGTGSYVAPLSSFAVCASALCLYKPTVRLGNKEKVIVSYALILSALVILSVML